ncbi:MAG: hypothetical protein WD226_11370 [Planctomycetota bacterium]
MSHSRQAPGPISQRVELLRLAREPLGLARMESGWATLNEQQPGALAGCCVLLPDPVVGSVNQLADAARTAFLADLIRLGDAVLAATAAERINYLILCNQVEELHAHVVPRFSTEDPALRRLGPFEAYDFASARAADPSGADAALGERLRRALAAPR